MPGLDKTAIHPLIQKPDHVSIASRNAIIAAYHEHITDLKDVFNTSHDLWAPPFPVTIYSYSDNGGRLSDTAAKEIDRFLNDSVNAVSVLSGIAAPTISYADTPAQAWVQGGFDHAQTTRHGLSGVGNVTFLNCAPRLDERGAADNKTNKGEPVYVGILPNGHVVTANSRFNFVFFRDAIENGELEVFESKVQPDGTQFRSRDIFTMHTALLANLLTQNIDHWKPQMTLEERRELLSKVGYVDLEKPLKAEDIPELPQFTVAHIDVHGNVKLNTRASEIEPHVLDHLKNQTFTIVLNDEKLVEARFTERMFDRKKGEAGLSEGSSGRDWQGAANHDGFLELSIISGDAAAELDIQAEQFKNPITIQIPELAVANDLPFIGPPVPRIEQTALGDENRVGL